jgi:hypothetical protein
VTTRKLPSKAISQSSSTYIGKDGEIFYDTDTNSLKISDGTTLGGVLINTNGSGSIGLNFVSASQITQLNMSNVGTLITISGSGVGVLRLPQITSAMLGAEFEFFFSVDAGQIHIQSYYTGVRETTDVFRGSIYVGVDNATTGKLHKATATTSTACDLFLGQHHAKAGSYVKVKAIDSGTVGTWMFQGMCIGDTGQTPNSSDHPFQDYN